MIQRPKQICLIYGGSGKHYAQIVAERIEREEEADRIPITVKLILEQILTGDMVGGLMDIVHDSDLFVIFMTAEDIGGPSESELKMRVRQNVLLEVGMALYAAGHKARDKLIFASDIENLNELELPSDLASFSIKAFNKQGFDTFCDELIEKIQRLLELQPHLNLLSNSNYYSNYKRLFSNRDSEIFSYSGRNQLQVILNHWLEDCQRINRFDQKVLFVLERLTFFPIFGRHQEFRDWLHQLQECVEISDHDDTGLHSEALTVLNLCLEHIESRTQADSNSDEHTHLDIYRAFENVISKLSRYPSLNPVLKLCAHDYFGLACLKAYSFRRNPDLLKQAQKAFILCLETVPAQDANPGFWKGYLEYNLTRVHRELYRIEAGEEHAEAAERLAASAVLTRKKWIRISEYPSVFRNALSYEYFLARIEQIRLAQDRGKRSPQWIAEQIERVLFEVDAYYAEGEVLHQFSEIQQTLEKLKG